MLNEEKVKLMTKLALYEQREGRKAFFMNKLYKKDYLSLQIIKNAFITTICYFLLLFLWVIYKVDYFMKYISSINFVVMIVIIIVLYIFIMAFYIVLSYYYHKKKYIDIKKNLVAYNENLKELHRLYKTDSKSKEDKSPGGSDNDVETFNV